VATAVPMVSRRPKVSARQAEIEEELKRLVARELHDRVAQTLTGMLVDVENFKAQQVGWEEVVKQMDIVQDSTREVLVAIRRMLHDLRGDDHVGASFSDSIRSLITRFQDKTHVPVDLEVKPDWPEALAPTAFLNMYRIIEEALSNVRMHSKARSVRIVLEPRPENELAIVVRDDGQGLDTDQGRPMGLGTLGMKERAFLLGGQVRIDSEPGRGTTIQAVFPRRELVTQPAGGSFELVMA
jgi:two-component system, NarL family, sensor histidine kinase UhpB